ncbi:MAG: trehalose-phosphatase, partial [candidate division Zixibacteria bacterium]
MQITSSQTNFSLMEILKPGTDPERFFSELSSAKERLLMLDYDGTLSPFVTKRDEAIPYPGIRERLAKLVSSEQTRIVIISGRPTANLTSLLGLQKLPELFGCHGAERLRPDGLQTFAPLSASVHEGLLTIRSWAEKNGLAEIIEEKPVSLAFHWRDKSSEQASELLRVISSE